MSCFSVFVFVLGVLNAEEKEAPGPRTVHTRGAYCSKPHTSRGFIAEAKIGEVVEVIAFEGLFAKVKHAAGEAYISRSSLVKPEEYQKGPANEEQMMAMKAQGYEAGRFDPETENERRRQNPNLAPGYEAVIAFEKRQSWTADRKKLSEELLAFQKEGGLAEFSNVKK